MAGSSKANPPKPRKRVEAETATTATSCLVRAKDGSAFTKCEGCNKDVAVALIGFHDCSLDAKIKMNLEAQVVEMQTEVKKKTVDKKKPSSEPKAKKAKTEKKGKKTKDPNMPKRPPTAFFIFMDDFRKEYKEANPDSKNVKEVAKQGGDKWKSMSDEEKKAYMDKATELKAEYEKAMEAYNAEDKEVSPDEAEEKSDKEEAVEKETEEITDEE